MKKYISRLFDNHPLLFVVVFFAAAFLFGTVISRVFPSPWSKYDKYYYNEYQEGYDEGYIVGSSAIILPEDRASAMTARMYYDLGCLYGYADGYDEGVAFAVRNKNASHSDLEVEAEEIGWNAAYAKGYMAAYIDAYQNAGLETWWLP